MLRLRFGAVLASLLVSIIVVPGAFAQKVLEEVVARVGNDIILKSEFEGERKNLRDELAQRGLQGAQLEQAFQEQSKDILRNLIDTSLLTQQAKEMGISPDLEVVKQEERMRQEHNRTSAAKDQINSIDDLEKAISQQMSLDDFKLRLKSRYLTGQVLNREVYNRVVITQEEVHNFYDAHQKDFERPAGVHIREISVNTQGMGPAEVETQRKKIDDALAAIKKGDDFG